MKTAAIVAFQRDQERAALLRDALSGFDIEARCFLPDDPGLPKKPACVIVCWSVGAEPGALGRSRAIRNAAKKRRCINIKLDETPPTLPGQTVDLSKWQGGKQSNVIAALAGRIRSVFFMFRIWQWRVPIGAGATAVLTAVLHISGVIDVAEAPSKVCAAGFFPGSCSRWGLGGVPTPKQEADYQRALAAGCRGLRDFVSRAERNPRRADAQAKLDGIRRYAVETWRRDMRQLDMFISGDVAPTREAARSLASAMSQNRASRVCSRFEQIDDWRLKAARPDIGNWLCERNEDGWRCRASGSASCALQRRTVTQYEDCS